jgi:hypothetical protein
MSKDAARNGWFYAEDAIWRGRWTNGGGRGCGGAALSDHQPTAGRCTEFAENQYKQRNSKFQGVHTLNFFSLRRPFSVHISQLIPVCISQLGQRARRG